MKELEADNKKKQLLTHLQGARTVLAKCESCLSSINSNRY